MKILQVLTYYRPHVSGLTIYVERLCRALVDLGHDVTVLTAQYDPSLSREERLDGVRVIRVPVAFRVSKGVIMPTFGLRATQHVIQSEIVHLHLPQFDAPGLALRGKLFRKPVVLTYHSDLQLPPGAFNRVVDRVVMTLNRTSGALADRVVTYTDDFGRHSPYLKEYVDRKLTIIPPPVTLAPCGPEDVAGFRDRHNLVGKKVVGIAARLAAEKGIEVLLKALPKLLDDDPNTVILHAGPNAAIIGEEAYAARLAPQFEKYRDNYRLLGNLHGAELTAFYKSLDCLVLCSLNNTETFGLVQIEAMMNGVPCVASDLPGVRVPISLTGMGEIVPVGDADALAGAIGRVLTHPKNYRGNIELIAATFAPAQTAAAYEQLYRQLKGPGLSAQLTEPAAYLALRATHNT